MERNFIIFTSLIKHIENYRDVNVIIEVGARDCRESVGFTEEFPNAMVHSFECNPETLPFCEKVVSGNDRIKLNKYALSDTVGELNFFQIDTKNTETTWLDGNPGASSIFEKSGKYDHVEDYKQVNIKVVTGRLDSYLLNSKISMVDFLWMDVQGAEKIVLEGAGVQIDRIKYIHTEVEFIEIYKNQVLFEELVAFLSQKEFVFIGFSYQGEYSGDAIFVNKRLVDNDKILNAKKYLSYLINSNKSKTHLYQKIYNKIYRKFYIDKLVRFVSAFTKRKLFEISKTLIIETKYDGLGDHLFYSHIPEIAKKLGYKKVFISNKNKYRSPEIRYLVWECNPYVDGFIDKGGLIIEDFDDISNGENLLDVIMLAYGLDDGVRYHDPKIYKKISLNNGLVRKVMYDPNYVSYVGNIDKRKIEQYFVDKNITVDYQFYFREKFVPISCFNQFYRTSSIDDYCQAIISCEEFYCLTSGGATLAAALGKKAIAFYGMGQKKMFHHSKNASYIEII